MLCKFCSKVYLSRNRLTHQPHSHTILYRPWSTVGGKGHMTSQVDQLNHKHNQIIIIVN